MGIDQSDLKRHYASLLDEVLLEMDPADLTESARQCLLDELNARGLAIAPAVEQPPAEVDADGTQLAVSSGNQVLVASYETPDETNLARTLLRTAGIPSSILDGRPERNIQLMVAPELLDDALAVLSSEISEDDLIAQAEAAGISEAVPQGSSAQDGDEDVKGQSER